MDTVKTQTVNELLRANAANIKNLIHSASGLAGMDILDLDQVEVQVLDWITESNHTGLWAPLQIGKVAVEIALWGGLIQQCIRITGTQPHMGNWATVISLSAPQRGKTSTSEAGSSAQS